MLGIAHNPFTGFKSHPPNLGSLPIGSKTTTQADTPARTTASADLYSRVDQVLKHRLAETLGVQSPVPVPAAGRPYDPETIASNVLSFVQGRLQQARAGGAGPEELASLLDKAKSGIAQGMQEAKEALEGMGLLSESLKAGIEQAGEMIFKGLAADGATPVTGHGANLIEASQRFRQVETSAFELQVQTRDGDLVTLKFQQQNREQGMFSLRQTANATEFSGRHAESSRSHLSLTVEGDLDEDELSAITDLAQNVQRASESFFDGNVQAAFEQGMKLGYDTDEIAGFSLEMSHSLNSVATTRYREIRELDAAQTPKMSGLEQVGGLVNRLSGMLEQAKNLFEDGQQATSDMLKGFVSRHPNAAEYNDLLEQAGGEKLQDVAERLVQRASHH